MNLVDLQSSPVRPWQPLMRAIDVQNLDLEKMFARIIKNGIDSLIVNAAGFMNWYPSNLTYQKPNPFMSNDFLGSIIEIAKKNKIKIFARVDISKGYADWYKEHPDWYVVKDDGQPDKYWDLYKTCFTGDYVQNINFEILNELLSNYDVDGLFYNFYYFEKCFCERCQKLFYQETGNLIPDDEKIVYPYERFRHREVARHIKRIRQKLRSLTPNASLLVYHHMHKSWDPRLVSDEVDIWTSQISSPFIPNPLDPQPVWPFWPSEEAMKGNALKKQEAPWLILTYSQIFSSRRVNQPGDRLNYQMAQCIAHGARACPSLNGLADRQDDPRGIIEVENTIRNFSNHSFFLADTHSIDDIALVYSPDSFWFGPDQNNPNGSQYGHTKEFRGVFSLLKASRQQFSVLYSQRLDHGSEKYKIMILPGVQCLSKEDQIFLNNWIVNGGWIIVTADTGAFDENGIHYDGVDSSPLRIGKNEEIDSTGGYLSINSESLRKRNEGSSLLGLVGPFYKTNFHCTENPLSLLGPFKNNAPEFSYWNESNGIGQSGLIFQRTGLGGIVSIPWHIGSLFYQFGIPDYLNLMDWVITEIKGESIFVTDAPHSVEIVIRMKKEANKLFWIIHLINGSSGADRPFIKFIPITPIKFSIKKKVKRALQLLSGIDLSVVENDGTSEITTEVINGYEILILEIE